MNSTLRRYNKSIQDIWMLSKYCASLFLLFVLVIGPQCKKMVQIPAPRNSITTEEVFADSADAASAISGIYSSLIYGGSGGVNFGSGFFSIYCGLSADELLPFVGRQNLQFSYNKLLSNNAIVYDFWYQGYTYLYQANAAIEGLDASTTLPSSIKNELIGEAKWIRAFINFYLVNLFGNIPLVTSTSYLSNESSPRTSSAEVYQSILTDLKDAQSALPGDYSVSNGERTRANKWAATGLLARVYLYMGDYSDAEAQAAALINNSSMYSLVQDPNDVFLANSKESILQLGIVTNVNTATFNLTPEGYTLIPSDSTQPPSFYITPELFSSFENGDLRYSDWLDSTTYNGTTYYYPYKYKNGAYQLNTSAAATEYYMVLRLAEQYLIHAEALALQSKNPSVAIDDLNIIRTRANLPNLPSNLTQPQIVAAIAQERRIELFAEWGNRWFDLKRTNQGSDILGSITYKQPWQSYKLLYPVPGPELQTDPSLTQNPGY